MAEAMTKPPTNERLGQLRQFLAARITGMAPGEGEELFAKIDELQRDNDRLRKENQELREERAKRTREELHDQRMRPGR